MKPQTLFFIIVLGLFFSFSIYGLYFYKRRSQSLDLESSEDKSDKN